MTKVKDEPLLQLWNASWRLTRNAEKELEEIGLRRPEIIVMAMLRYGPMLQTVLAHDAGMPRSTLSDVLSRLERLDYVERSDDPLDRRYKYVALTRFHRRARGEDGVGHDP